MATILELERSIPEARTMREQTPGANALLEKGVKRQMASVRKAAEAGQTHCVWVLDNLEYENIEDKARRIFENRGYTLRPTGVIGGVMQTTKEIWW